jgi:uncharacterized protein (TIGR02453 family)
MASPPSFPGFRPAALTFFRGLRRSNNKEWFEAHRPVYEDEIKRPLALLVDEIDARLGDVAPELVGQPKRSIFRIHRDIRFSNDKSPYKTNAACWFFHRDVGHGVGSQAAHGGAGFYFHLEPNACMCGGGIWMPPSPTLATLRQAIADDHRTFTHLVTAPAFRKTFGPLSQEAVLTRPPKGYSADHPAIDWLRYKSFSAVRPLSAADVQSPKLPTLLMKYFSTMLPFVRWLNQAVGLPPHSRR